MNQDRISGVLLHVTSLPSYGGVGDFGPAAYEFVDFLAAAKQRLWQVLPLSPTGYGSSPYSALSPTSFPISVSFFPWLRVYFRRFHMVRSSHLWFSP